MKEESLATKLNFIDPQTRSLIKQQFHNFLERQAKTAISETNNLIVVEPLGSKLADINLHLTINLLLKEKAIAINKIKNFYHIRILDYNTLQQLIHNVTSPPSILEFMHLLHLQGHTTYISFANVHFILAYNCKIQEPINYVLKTLETMGILEYQTMGIFNYHTNNCEDSVLIKLTDLDLSHIFLILLNNIEQLNKSQREEAYILLKTIKIVSYNAESKLYEFYHPNSILGELANISDNDLLQIVNASNSSGHSIEDFLCTNIIVQRTGSLLNELKLRDAPDDKAIYKLLNVVPNRNYFMKNWQNFANDFASFIRLVEEGNIFISARTLEIISNFSQEVELFNKDSFTLPTNQLDCFFSNLVHKAMENEPGFKEAKSDFNVAVNSKDTQTSNDIPLLLWQNHISNDNKTSLSRNSWIDRISSSNASHKSP